MRSLLALLMMTGIIFSDNISMGIEGGLYRDRIVFLEQTQYQKIVITKHKDDMRLYIDGNCQFSTADEYRYHEALVHVPMSQLDSCQKVLILGGGDGMAVSIVSVSVNSFFCVSSSACLLSRFCS